MGKMYVCECYFDCSYVTTIIHIVRSARHPTVITNDVGPSPLELGSASLGKSRQVGGDRKSWNTGYGELG